jgi:V8-like Glu-specific endopeptidase
MNIQRIVPTVLLATCSTALAGPTTGTQDTRLPKDVIPVVTVPNLDYASLGIEDETRERTGLPPQFAVPFEQHITPATDGIWERVDMNTQRWSLRVACDNALSMNVGFGRFNLPASGSMIITDATGDYRIRPFTADDNKSHGQLWTPVVPGSEAIIEITVANKDRAMAVKGIELTSINPGYRWVHDAAGRGSSESCNIDVVCAEGDPWQEEIPSVAVYTLNGYLTCSGVMMNNSAQDQTPYFLTANHCGVTNSSDSSIVVYWNHQNSYCRAPGSSDSGGNGNGNFNQFTSGSTMRATRSYSDFTLTELSSNPNAAWGVTYSGWSRAGSASLGAGIHHPEAAEKRISFPDTVNATGEYWDVNWGEGRTAPGSSGSPLYDGNHRVVGQLCCGASYCPNDYNDYYGRSLDLAWSGSANSSLSSWLDPTGSGAQFIDTLVPGGGGDPQGACCIGTTCSYGTENDCNISGGEYAGDFVSCTSYPCGGAPEGACCIAGDCSVMTASECGSFGGSYQGDGSTCTNGICDNGGCEVGYSPDCAGTCFEDSVYTDWVGDGFCDDGAYVPSDYGYGGPAGVAIYLNCDAFNCDNDDCTDCGGGGDPTGACCVNGSCSIINEADCTSAGGTYNGDNSSCNGDPCGGGGECPAGEMQDCNGNCCPENWVADGYCDDGTYEWNGVAIYLNCDAFQCDGGDCTGCGGGGDPTGACCVGTNCSTMTDTDCAAAGGEYQGNNTSCASEPCGGGGGECPADWTADCEGTCFPDYVYAEWQGDGYCDDGAYIPADYGCDECPAGVAIWMNCDEFDCDSGDCECDGGGNPMGACCFDADCFELEEAECNSNGGEWQGPETTCASSPCAVPCPADTDGSGAVDVSDILYIVGYWGTNDSAADVNGDGTVNVSDILEVVSAWGPCQ